MSMRDAFNKAGHGGAKQYSGQKHGGSYPQRQGQSNIQSEHLPSMPKIVFRDKSNYRKKELFTDYALQYADELTRHKITQTQLRKYYNEVKALEARIKANPDFKANEALISLLKSKVAYGLAKETDRDKKEGFKVLLNMVEQGIAWSTKPEYFEDFVLLFEAVAGFFKGKER